KPALRRGHGDLHHPPPQFSPWIRPLHLRRCRMRRPDDKVPILIRRRHLTIRQLLRLHIPRRMRIARRRRRPHIRLRSRRRRLRTQHRTHPYGQQSPRRRRHYSPHRKLPRIHGSKRPPPSCRHSTGYPTLGATSSRQIKNRVPHPRREATGWWYRSSGAPPSARSDRVVVSFAGCPTLGAKRQGGGIVRRVPHPTREAAGWRYRSSGAPPSARSDRVVVSFALANDRLPQPRQHSLNSIPTRYTLLCVNGPESPPTNTAPSLHHLQLRPPPAHPRHGSRPRHPFRTARTHTRTLRI